MLLTPADRGPGMQPAMGRPAPAGAWLALTVSELSAPIGQRATRLAHAGALVGGPFGSGAIDVGLAEASVRSGGCFVRPLPLDHTCASAARRFLREALAGSDLPSDLIHDGVTMASDLPPNPINAHRHLEFLGHARPS